MENQSASWLDPTALAPTRYQGSDLQFEVSTLTCKIDNYEKYAIFGKSMKKDEEREAVRFS